VATLVLLGIPPAFALDDTPKAAPTAPISMDAAPADAAPVEAKPDQAAPPEAEPKTHPDGVTSGTRRPNTPPDRDQPIHIKADRIEINQRKSTTLYIGRVSFTQGGLRINAARAEARYKGDKIDTVIASGNPVTLFQPSETPGQDLHVSALRLEYHALDGKADLFDEVRLQQGTNVVLCKTLHYDLTESTLSAEGDGADNRVTVTIESSTIEKPAATPASGTQNRSRP
jgi:lipopolysaccharide export system protein LptA